MSAIRSAGAGATPVTIRPIRPGDKGALADLFDRLSARSRMRRFLGAKPALSERELQYFTEVDHRTHEALVAVDSAGAIAGVARYACAPGEERVADVAFAVADAWHGRGVGGALARALVERARDNGVARLGATTAAENGPARGLLRGLGFRVTGIDGAVLELTMELEPCDLERAA